MLESKIERLLKHSKSALKSCVNKITPAYISLKKLFKNTSKRYRRLAHKLTRKTSIYSNQLKQHAAKLAGTRLGKTVLRIAHKIHAIIHAIIIKIAKFITHKILPRIKHLILLIAIPLKRLIIWTYKNSILRLHKLLIKHFNWYKRLNTYRKTEKGHWINITASAMLAIVLVFTLQRATIAAPDLNDLWNFATPADYTADSGAEVTNNTARLKTLNYTDDANTKALYHLDEASGTSATDSSSNANTGTVANATFGAGHLNNALSFNGSTSKLTAPSTTANKLTQQNTLEAWTKFDSAFSAGSHDQRQTVLEKGDYRLFYDNNTGKLNYELGDSAAPTINNQKTWAAWNGGLPNTTFTTVNCSANIGNDLYIGTVGGQVWQLHNNIWTQVGGSGINGSWTGTSQSIVSMTVMSGVLYVGQSTANWTYVYSWDGSAWTLRGSTSSEWGSNPDGVMSLANDGTTIYAGLGFTSGVDAQVWKYNGGTSWTQIGGNGINGSWPNGTYTRAISLSISGGQLYAGTQGTISGDGELWRCTLASNCSSWTKIGGDGTGWANNQYSSLYRIQQIGNYLYAGLGVGTGKAVVWRCDTSTDCATTWTKVGGDGVNSSWAAATYEQVRSFATDGTNLYAGLGNDDGDGEVWKCDSTTGCATWTKIGGDGLNGSFSNSPFIGSLTYMNSKLYVGSNIEEWTWDGATWTNITTTVTAKKRETVSSIANYKGQVLAGLGYEMYDPITYPPGTDDAELFLNQGTDWNKIGGDGINGSWSNRGGSDYYYGVNSLYTNNNDIYAGLYGTAGSAEVWKFNGTTWTKIGGGGTNGSWSSGTYLGVYTLTMHNGQLIAGIGSTTNGDSEVWSFNGTTWTKIGGDGVNSSWSNLKGISSLMSSGGDLYAGTFGNNISDGELWKYSGGSWTKIGGDGVNSSWNSGGTGYFTYAVATMAVYDGEIYAGIGGGYEYRSLDSTRFGYGEVWKFNGSTWTKISGQGLNGGWSENSIGGLSSLVVYEGKLYAGVGNVGYNAKIWRWDGSSWTNLGTVSSFAPGSPPLTVVNNSLYAGGGSYTAGNAKIVKLSPTPGVVQSTTTSFDTNWHHVAGTYDGATMKLYIDGVLNNSVSAALSLPTTNAHLTIGNGIGNETMNSGQTGAFTGQIDEVRISDIERTSLTTKPYSTTPQAVNLTNAVRKSGVWHWDNFTDTETTNGGTITYRLSDDNGTTWKYWNGSNWIVSSVLTQSNSVADINTHIATFPVTFDGIKWQAVLSGNGDQRVTLNTVNLASTSDSTLPTEPTSILGKKALGGDTLALNAWTNGSSPAFTWTAGTDAQSGIKGYCAYLGTTDTSNPVTTKGLLGTSPVATGGHCQFIIPTADLNTGIPGYIATAMTTSNSPYYLILKAIDGAGNVSTNTASFHFRFDNTAPTPPSYIGAPSGYINTKNVTLTWPSTGAGSPADSNSQIAGLQYRIGSSGTWYGDSHTGSGDINDLLTNDGAYTTTPTPDYANLIEGVNTVYFRSWDNAGNISETSTTAAVKINTSGAPSEPLNLQATPSTNTVNSFAFSWDAPNIFVGDQANLTYCYTINILPSDSTCTFTSAGVTSLTAAPYATQHGANILYVVARDESNNINYGTYSSVVFNANTPSPGIPNNSDIGDVSVKSTQNWRLAIIWESPTFTGAGVTNYKVYRSTDNTTFTQVGTSTSTTFIDTGLSSRLYYYKVTACDSANNCGAQSTTVSMIPTGKFTSPATLTSQPRVTNITTRKATITWNTDRNSDSKVAFGTTSGKYSPSEIANSSQVSAHEIQLDNLSAGTTYYFVAKWTDEDGNTGTSQEYTFTTAPPPALREINTTNIKLNNAVVQFTSRNSSRIILQYGTSDSFGSVIRMNTSITESTYNVPLNDLADGVKYFYQIISYDSENTAYPGPIFSFTTPPRPRISNLAFQPIEGEPTSTQKVTWNTNVPTTSSVEYGKVGVAGIETLDSKLVVDHELIIRGLDDDSRYTLIARSRDADGNLGVSDQQFFNTALDTRAPVVSDINVETSIKGIGSEARGQIIVSWHTDEPSTSQVAFAEGSDAVVFNSRTAEDTALSTEHLVVISNLPTSRVYTVSPLSRDKALNLSKSSSEPAIVGRAADDILTIVLNVLRKIFGF